MCAQPQVFTYINIRMYIYINIYRYIYIFIYLCLHTYTHSSNSTSTQRDCKHPRPSYLAAPSAFPPLFGCFLRQSTHIYIKYAYINAYVYMHIYICKCAHRTTTTATTNAKYCMHFRPFRFYLDVLFSARCIHIYIHICTHTHNNKTR